MAPSSTAYTILAFGVTSFLSGAYSLLFPNRFLLTFSLPASALPAARGNALAAIAMGIYYTLAAVQENRAFFAATVPMRLLTATVFWMQGEGGEGGRGRGWRVASLWEGIGAGLTGLMLLLEKKGGGKE